MHTYLINFPHGLVICKCWLFYMPACIHSVILNQKKCIIFWKTAVKSPALFNYINILTEKNYKIQCKSKRSGNIQWLFNLRFIASTTTVFAGFNHPPSIHIIIKKLAIMNNILLFNLYNLIVTYDLILSWWL